MAEPFISQITMYGCNFAVRGWAFCEGQPLAINQNNALFSLLGTIYGGDGRTRFNLPDFRGRAPMQEGQGPGLSMRPIGMKGGSPDVTLTLSQLPFHYHALSLVAQTQPSSVSMQTSAAGPDTNDPDNAYFDLFPPGQDIYSGSLSQPAGRMGEIPVRPLTTTIDGPTGLEGGNQPWHVQSPYQVVTMQIALQGVFPSRN